MKMMIAAGLHPESTHPLTGDQELPESDEA